MEDYRRCCGKAIERTRALLVRENESTGYDEIHSVKSVLYAAIERAGMSAERMIETQKKLRELLFLVNLHSDPQPGDKEQAQKILERLNENLRP